MFGGIIAAGILFALLWQLPGGRSETFYFVWFLVGSIIFYIGYTVFATPWVALGYELTPDYHERTRLKGTQNFIGQLAYVASPWFLWIMNPGKFWRNADGDPDQVAGAAGPAVVVAVVAIGLVSYIYALNNPVGHSKAFRIRSYLNWLPLGLTYAFLYMGRYNLKVSQLKLKTNVQRIAFPRQIAMYLCKQLTTRSLPEIGRRFGGRDHTTVLHAVDKIRSLMQSDADVYKDVNSLSHDLRTT